MTESCVKKFDEKKNQFDNELLKSRISKLAKSFLSNLIFSKRTLISYFFTQFLFVLLKQINKYFYIC